ncbi:MAG TPA: hypothetical protein VFP72_01300 [Kineosporiaceae bacterium]|nr:hypothetical protein [Kineosporiaceae bacterium]
MTDTAPPSRYHETSATSQRRAKLPSVATGKGRDASSLPIGVLLSAEGGIKPSGGPATPSGGIEATWGEPRSSSTPLPRREPRGPGRAERHEVSPTPSRPLPRRRDLRGGSPSERSGGSWAPRSYPVKASEAEELPPGVVRLDEPVAAAPARSKASAGATGQTDSDTRLIVPRHDRATLFTDPNGTGRISRLLRPVPDGPVTGSLDVDADLFTPASERRARLTASQGIPVVDTPSGGIPTAYPRRRDLRGKGAAPVTGPVTTGPVTGPVPAAGGSSFVPTQSGPAACSGGIPLGTLPRRRDLRHGGTGPIPVVAQPEPETAERTGGERTGAIAVGVARAAVMTMLVGVGYAVVGGHQFHFDGGGDSASPDAAGAMMAGQSATTTTKTKIDWDAHSEVAAIKAAAEQQRAAAAERAAAQVQAAKAAADARAAEVAAVTRDAQRNPQAVAKLLAAQRGWGSTQFTCLDLLWTKESGWNYRATNPSSGAYGIPQALPGSKMGAIASDWRTNPTTQIKWGLNYIADVYGTPCGAWSHSKRTGWY